MTTLLSVVLFCLVVQCFGGNSNEDNVVVMDQNVDEASPLYGMSDANSTRGESDGEKLDKHDTLQQQEKSDHQGDTGTGEEDKVPDEEDNGMNKEHTPGPENKQEDGDAHIPNEGMDNGYPEEGHNVWATAGNGTNCGPPGSQLEFHWEPYIIDPQGSVTIWIKMHFADDFDHGSIIVDVAVRGQPHPIFTVAMAVSCEEDIKKEVKILTCPLQKGMPFKYKLDQTNLTRLPTGAFHVRVRLVNENQKDVVCLEADAELRPEGDY